MRQWSLIAFALVVGLAFGFTAAPLLHNGQPKESYPTYAEAVAQPEQRAGGLPAKTEVSRLRYKEPCHQPQGRDESELCAEWRSTSAAEQAGRSSISQTLANWLAVVGLLATLVVSANAAKHAAAAAEATRDANRPWIEGEAPTEIKVGLTAEAMALAASVRMVNYGNSPATNALIQAKIVAIRASDQKAESIRRSAIEARLDKYETEHSRRGKILFPKKPSTGELVASVLVDEIREAEGEEHSRVEFILVVGITYRFGEKKGRTVAAYLLNFVNHAPYPWGRYHVPDGQQIRIVGEQIELWDTQEGFAI